MSLNLNDSDFQCLQDQIIDLKAKNYELAQKDRRSHADFEAAKAKICSLQLKLEEQERDFQVISTTLRREIETLTGVIDKENSKDEDYKTKYKKLLHKAKELQSRYEKAVEIIQQLDDKNQLFSDRVEKLESNYLRKCNEWESMWEEIESNWTKTIKEYKNLYTIEKAKYDADLGSIRNERDNLKKQVDKLSEEVMTYDSRLEAEAEERKIHEKKFNQMIKELKRQLGLEQSRNETLQKRLETLLISIPASETTCPSESQKSNQLSTTSSNNGNSSGKTTNIDANSVGSWSFVKGKNGSQALNETLSLCSIDSDDRETVQQTCDTKSESDQRKSIKKLSSPSTKSTNGPVDNSAENERDVPSSGMLIEEQAALMERLTQMQHDKWQLEEKLSYLEQTNVSLSQDLANKSDLIRHHFMDQANKSTSPLSFNTNSNMSGQKLYSNNRRSSLTSNFNHIISEKPGFKKVVDFLKERSHLPESECLSKEATKRMQLMLEETLIKNLKLQENLDYVTSELNRLKG